LFLFCYVSNDWALFDRIRGQDIKLLKELKVGYIFDLMVEKKKVKYGMKYVYFWISILGPNFVITYYAFVLIVL
jgi:hypothetical protein